MLFYAHGRAEKDRLPFLPLPGPGAVTISGRDVSINSFFSITSSSLTTGILEGYPSIG